MNWTKLGLNVLKALPAIQRTVQAVKSIKSGADKKQAVMEAIRESLDVVENVTDKKVLDDPRVLAAIARANDVLVDVQNVIAEVTAEHKRTN